MRSGLAWMDRYQVVLFIAALLVGGAIGLAVPAAAMTAESMITPMLGLLLYVTFLGVPFSKVRASLRDTRFLATVLVVNFIAVPAVVFALTRFIAHDQALLVGALFVLLTPCIDYVIVFAGLAGGAKDRLLASTPVLMLLQIVLLPLYLWLFGGAELAASIDVGPFVEAFMLLIVVPLFAARLTQFAEQRTRWGARLFRIASALMVPLMMLTLAAVVASQISAVGARLSPLLLVIPIYIGFAVVMVPVGAVAARAARLDPPGRRAVVFSGVTRNSLVVLPLVLALPAGFELAPLTVVVQTLVELTVMVLLVSVVKRSRFMR